MATIAAMGSASAQVTITGSVSGGFQQKLDKSQGLAMGDNTLVVSASEDLGGGMKLSASWVIENDTARGTFYDRGDQSISLSTPIGSFSYLNTRSGGNQAAALVAPINLANDQFDSAVITREAVDTLVAAIPVNAQFAIVAKYTEGKAKDAKGTIDYGNPKNLLDAKGVAQTEAAAQATADAAAVGASASGAVTPGSTSFTLGGKYSANGLTIVGNYTSTDFTPTLLAVVKAAAKGDVNLTSTDLSIVYDAGIAKVGYGYDSSRRGKAATDAAANMFGISVPMGAITVGLNYGSRDAASFTMVGAQYDLSKRTNVNASWGNNKASSTADTDTQYRLSINHSF